MWQPTFEPRPSPLPVQMPPPLVTREQLPHAGGTQSWVAWQQPAPQQQPQQPQQQGHQVQESRASVQEPMWQPLLESRPSPPFAHEQSTSAGSMQSTLAWQQQHQLQQPLQQRLQRCPSDPMQIQQVLSNAAMLTELQRGGGESRAKAFSIFVDGADPLDKLSTRSSKGFSDHSHPDTFPTPLPLCFNPGARLINPIQ